jgi:soluble lytic murein transglycosylase-like protein
MKSVFISLLVVVPLASAHATCFEEAGVLYNVNPDLLRGMAKVESSMRPEAINETHQARTKSVDLGLMQINSRWLPILAKNNITKESLLKDPCLNVKVGAWILADNIRRHGPNWTAVGAYNAACSQLKGADCENARMLYATKVWRAIDGKSKARQETKVAPVSEVVEIKQSRIASLDIPDIAHPGVENTSNE